MQGSRFWPMTYLRPSDYSIFDHEVLCHGRRYLGHMMAVVFFAHTRFPVSQYGQTQEVSIWVVQDGRFSNRRCLHFRCCLILYFMNTR